MIGNLFGHSWKRKIVNTNLGPIFEDVKPSPEFINMLDILREAERYDSIKESDLRDSHLIVLKEYIDEYVKFSKL